jgi:hypothetical protein
MPTFVSRRQHYIQATLSGFARLRVVGSQSPPRFVNALFDFQAATGVVLNEIGQRAIDVSEGILR